MWAANGCSKRPGSERAGSKRTGAGWSRGSSRRPRAHSFRAAALLCLLGTGLVGTAVHGDRAVAETIGLLYDDQRLAKHVARAIALWQPCCDGVAVPRLFDNLAGERVLYLSLRKSSGDQRCGTFSGQRITVYLTARGPAGRVVRCGDPALNLAHEIGHALGLEDLTESTAGRHHIMSPIYHANAFRRSVSVFECGMAVAARTRTLERLLGASGDQPLEGAVAPVESLQ